MKYLLNLSFVFFCCQIQAQDDKGIGVVFFLQSVPNLDNPKRDSVMIYSRPNLRSSVIDKFVFDPNDRFKQLVNTKFELSGSIEFDNETFGLPVCSILASGWFEVIYNNNKKPGFVKMSKTQLKYLPWKVLLPKEYLFFQSVYNIQFFDMPNGKKQKFELALSDHQIYDYIMKPLEVRDVWMKVQVTTPSDYCFNPQNKTTKIFWIRYLNEKGRPLVWYFTRGC